MLAAIAKKFVSNLAGGTERHAIIRMHVLINPILDQLGFYPGIGFFSDSGLRQSLDLGVFPIEKIIAFNEFRINGLVIF